MPDIPIPFGVRVEMIYLFGATRCQNVYHVTKGAAATSGDLTSLWTVFRDWEQNTARNFKSTNTALVLISLTATDGPGAPFYELAPNPNIFGSVAGTNVPSYTTIAIKHTSGKQGRSYRGRTYWIGLTTSLLATQDAISTANATALAGYFNTLRTNLATAGWQFCVASRYSGVNASGKAIPRASGILTPITASSCESYVDTQRHRKLPHQV